MGLHEMKTLFLYVTCLSMLIYACGCGPFKVSLGPVDADNHNRIKLPGCVGLDLSDLGIDQKTANNDSLAGGALKYDVDWKDAFPESIVNYARGYFQDVSITDTPSETQYDYLLRFKAKDARWWWGFGLLVMPLNHEMTIEASMFSSEEKLLDQVTALGHGQVNATSLDPWPYVKLYKTAGEQAMKDALEKAFNQLTASSQVRRYTNQLGSQTPIPVDPGPVVDPPITVSANARSDTAVGLGSTWAVVIGLSQYHRSGQDGLSELLYADDDAKGFARSLTSQGWSNSHIKLLTNDQATKRNVEIAVESWLTKAGPDDMVVLFWSGHGFPDPADPEKVYFACYDTDVRIPATGYRMDRVHGAIEELGCRNVVMLADTCHAGKLITRGDDRAIGIAPYVTSLTSRDKVPKGWIFMVASDVDRKAIEDSSWSHGAFTHCLLKALEGEADGYQSIAPRDGIVTMGELRSYMNTAMPEETQRILGVAKRPIITTSTGDPAIWDLSFKAK